MYEKTVQRRGIELNMNPRKIGARECGWFENEVARPGVW